MAQPSRHDTLELAQEAYLRYFAQCFWHMKPDLKIEEKHIATIVEGLRKYGGRQGFILAARLCL